MENFSPSFYSPKRKKAKNRKSVNEIGGVAFQGNSSYGSHSFGESSVLKCTPGAFLDAGKTTSPGFFNGGCPQPPAILGTWGPGPLYRWTDYLTKKKPDAVATAKNVMGLPNGLSMIHWKKNNLDSNLNNSYSLEMMTGWGSYSKKDIANDYGWVNGTIFNLSVSDKRRFQVPFVHIYYREVTGKKDGVEQGKLHFWEAALTKKKQIKKAGLIYDQLKEHIDTHFDAITSGKKFPESAVTVDEWPLNKVIDSVFYMGLDSNGQIPVIPSKYWSVNNAYPENNQNVLSTGHSDDALIA